MGIKDCHPFLNMPRKICSLQAAKKNAKQRSGFVNLMLWLFRCIPQNRFKNRQAALMNGKASDSCCALRVNNRMQTPVF